MTLLERPRGELPGQVLGLSRLFRRACPPDRSRRRSFPDAQPVRAVRFEPALQPGSRHRADRAGDRRACRHRHRYQSRERSPTGTANGFVFIEADPGALWATIDRALAVLARPRPGGSLIDNGMSSRLVLGAKRARVCAALRGDSAAGSPGPEPSRDSSESSTRSCPARPGTA